MLDKRKFSSLEKASDNNTNNVTIRAPRVTFMNICEIKIARKLTEYKYSSAEILCYCFPIISEYSSETVYGVDDCCDRT